jgi:hypothetical protein
MREAEELVVASRAKKWPYKKLTLPNRMTGGGGGMGGGPSPIKI